MTPLENAVEQLKHRTALIRAELDRSPPRINPLQQIIQGSVTPSISFFLSFYHTLIFNLLFFSVVNEGPLKICETFLTKPELFNQQHIDQLRQALHDFVWTCGFAISLNRSLIGPPLIPII